MTAASPRRILAYVSMAAAVAYGSLLIWNISFAVGGSDSSGYANLARQLLSGRVVERVAVLDWLELPDRLERAFVPLGYEPGRAPRTMVPMYPIGFPLHQAVAALVSGWDVGPFIVSPIASLLALLLTYQLGRQLELSRPMAFAGAAILGGCAVFLQQAVQPMSDALATCWCVAAVSFALRARRSDGWAAAAGAAVGLAVLVRPTDAIILAPVLLALPWRPRALLFAVLGGLPLAAMLGAFNYAVYGSALTTGYGGMAADTLSAANVAARLPHYLRWTAAQLSPLVLLLWGGAAFDRRVAGRDRALLLVWFGGFLAFFCFFRPYEAWWYTRFLLPAYPALVVGALCAARDLLRLLPEREHGALRSQRLRTLAAALLLVVVLVFEQRTWRNLQPLAIGRAQTVIPEACKWAKGKIGDRALVVSMEFSGALRYYTDLTPLMWNWIEPSDFETVAARAREKNYRVFRLLFDFEVEKASPQIPGKWAFIGKFRNANLWQLTD